MPEFESFDGTSLFYDDQGEGRAVVLLHGFAADTNINFVRPGIFDRLLDLGYRVIALDSRGHGLSGKPHGPEAYRDDAMANDVRALLDHLALDRCALIAYSMGTVTALRLAPREPRVQALVLLGAGRHVLDGEAPASRKGMLEAMTTDDPESLEEETPRAFRRMADAIRADRVALAAYLLAADEPSDVIRLGDVAIPVLVVAGSDDVTAAAPDEVAARIAGATAVTVPGDHFTANARPELHHAVETFLAMTG